MQDKDESFAGKAEAREAVWDRLDEAKVTAHPFRPRARIPNFKGAAEAAERLFTMPPWRNAWAIKVNPDSAQAPVRAEALRRGIEVYVATPKLAGGFMKFDPARIPYEAAAEASRQANWERWATPVALDELPRFDAIVVGSVAVTRDGHRAGKGAGFADLEFAILRELGHLPVPIATTIHPLQLVGGFPIEAIDQRLSAIVTPDEFIAVETPGPMPSGVDWPRLTEAEIASMPILAELRRSRLK